MNATSKRSILACSAALLVAAAIAFPWGSGDPPSAARVAASAPVAGLTPRAGGVPAAIPDSGAVGAGSVGGGVDEGAGGDESTSEGRPATTSVAASPGGPLADVAVVLRLRFADDRGGADGPVHAIVAVVNAGQKPVVLCDPQVDLVRRLEVLYRYRDRNHVASLPPGPVEPLDASRIVELAPREQIEVPVDLRPYFDSALGFGEGAFAFRVALRGDVDAVPTVVHAWNGDSEQVATSGEIVFHAPVPEWFEEMGGDGDLLNGVSERVFRWTPGDPGESALIEEIRRLGDPAVGALALSASRLGAPHEEAVERARKSLLLLRRLGDHALPVLRRVPPDAVVEMALEIVAEDSRARTGGAPAAAANAFAVAGTDDADATTFAITESDADGATTTFSLDRSGVVLVTSRTAGEDGETVELPLDEAAVDDLRRAVSAARPWTWRSVRTVRRAREGDVSFALIGPSGQSVWMLTMRGGEARSGNPFSAGLIRRFRQAMESTGVAPGNSER